MELNEVKKTLYKENPMADFVEIVGGAIIYELRRDDMDVLFRIPLGEVGEAHFGKQTPAKFLIRYIVKH